MRRSRLLGLPIGLIIVAVASTTPAAAEGLGGITGWQPPTAVCGEANIVPLLVANYTNVPQTGSITVDGDLAEQVTINPYSPSTCPSRDGTGRWSQNGTNYTQNVTIQPGTVGTYMISLGGVDDNLIGDDHTFSIGGLPGGTSGQSWYDFSLTLNADESFKYLQSYYENTGGTEMTNGQNGFNILSCNPIVPAAGDNVTVQGPIGSPFSSRSVNGPGYGFGAGICLGWLPQGQDVAGDITITGQGNGNAVGGVAAAQYNPELGTVSMVFNGVEAVSDVQIADGSGATISLPTTPGSPNGFWAFNGGNLLVESIPAFANTPVLITGGLTGEYVSLVNVPTASTATATITPPVTAGMFTVTGSSSNAVAAYPVIVGSTATTISVTVALQFNQPAVTAAFAASGNPEALAVVLTGITAPNGTTTSYNSTIGTIPSNAYYPELGATISLPVASSTQAFAAGNYITGNYVGTFNVVNPATGTVVNTFNATITVEPPA